MLNVFVFLPRLDEAWDVATDAEAPAPDAVADAHRELIRDALRADLEALLDAARAADDDAFDARAAAADAPFYAALARDCRACPALVDAADPGAWPAAVDALLARLPTLVDRAAAVAGSDARAYLVEALAEPVYYLSRRAAAGPDDGADDPLADAFEAASAAEAMDEPRLAAAFSAALRRAVAGGAGRAPELLEALANADDASELPAKYGAVLGVLRPLLLCKAAAALHDPQRRATLRRSLAIFPKRSVLALARLGALPSSRPFCATLAGLFVKPSFGGRSVMQRLATQSLGMPDAYATRDGCLRTANDSRLTAKALRAEFDDDELAQRAAALDDDAAAPPPKWLAYTAVDEALARLRGDRRRAAKRALDVDLYLRGAERLVAAYGDDAYVDFFVQLYPSLLAPVGGALQDPTLGGADALEAVCDAAAAAIRAFDDDRRSTADQLAALDAALGRAMGAVLGFGHRLALHEAPACGALADWASACVDGWRLDLDDGAVAEALARSPSTDEALNRVAPTYTEGLASQWRNRDGAAARDATAARRAAKPPTPRVADDDPVSFLRVCATGALADLGYVAVAPSVFAAPLYDGVDGAPDLAPVSALAEAGVARGDAALRGARDRGWLVAGALPRPRFDLAPRTFLVYRRDAHPDARHGVTFGDLRRLLRTT